MSSRTPQPPQTSQFDETAVDHSDAIEPTSSSEEIARRELPSDVSDAGRDSAGHTTHADQVNGNDSADHRTSEAPGGRASQASSRTPSIAEPILPSNTLPPNSPLPKEDTTANSDPGLSQQPESISEQDQTITDVQQILNKEGGAPATVGELPAEGEKTEAAQEQEHIPRLFWLMVGGTGQPPQRGNFWRQAMRRKAKSCGNTTENREESSGNQGQGVNK